jgi:hypothetical protein
VRYLVLWGDSLPRLSLSMKFLKDNIITAALIGAAGAIIAGVAAALITKSPISPEPIPPTPVPPSLAQGEWEIIEKVTIREKNVDIVWKYKPNIKDNILRLRGQKIKVDYKDPTSGEKKAISVCNLKFKGNQAEGECEESNAKGDVLITDVKLIFQDDFKSVTGYFEKDGRRGPQLIGTKL